MLGLLIQASLLESFICSVIGFQNVVDVQAAPQEGDAEIDALVQARTEAKKAKNFAEADRIRDQLKEMGIVLVDSKEGTTWHR